MKTRKLVFYILMCLPLAAVLAALPFLPGQVPAHYGFSGEVDRWGSKYELLILPALSLASGLGLLFFAKAAGKQEKSGHNNEKVFITAGLAVLALFCVITAYILYVAFQQMENLSALAWSMEQGVTAVLGVSMIVVGNFMPKLRRNALIGLRTSWSMKNDTTWKKSQRFGGISFIAAGAAMIVLSFLTKGTACMLWQLGILITVSIIDVYYTYRVARDDINS